MAVLLDVNVLLALSWDRHVHHEPAHRNFAELTSWSTTPITETGLVRLLMTEAVVGRRVSGQAAIAQLRAVRAVPGWRWLPDAASPAESSIDDRVLMGRRQVTDLHLVDLAAANGMTLATFDAGIRDSVHPDDRRWIDVWSWRRR